MLAEIFMLRLEVKAREGKDAAATSSRFVPVTLPVVKGPDQEQFADYSFVL